LSVLSTKLDIVKPVPKSQHFTAMSSNTDVFGRYLPHALLSQIFTELLSLEDTCRFDLAICNKKRRISFLDCVRSESFILQGDENRDFSHLISWLNTRSIKIRHLRCTGVTDDLADQISNFGSTLQWLSFQDQDDKWDLRKNLAITDIGLCKVAEGCPKLNTIDLSNCKKITDVSVIKMVELCPNLQSLNLTRCPGVTDISILKIA
jgi:hypothetical protein